MHHFALSRPNCPRRSTACCGFVAAKRDEDAVEITTRLESLIDALEVVAIIRLRQCAASLFISFRCA
jgi:hypothetical protein